MSFDGITLKSIIGELNNSLLGGKINKIFEPNKNEIITRIAKIVRRGSGLEKPQAATGLQFSKKLSHRQQGVKKRG